MTPPPAPAARLAYLLAALPPLFWAGNFVVARLMRDDIPPIQMSFWRWLVAFLILLPFGLAQFRAELSQVRKEGPFLALLGLIGVTAFNCLVYEALRHTTVINAALINSTMPVATFLLALALLGDRLAPRQVLGVLLSLSGAVAIIGRGDPAYLMGLAFNGGDLLVVGGLTFWALYTVLIRWRPTKLSLMAFLIATVGFGVLFHLPFLFFELRAFGPFALTGTRAAAIVFFAVFPSVLAYICWNKAVAALGPGRTGMFMHLMPLCSAALGWGFLDEPFLLYHAVGMGLIFCGILLVTRPVKVAAGGGTV